MPCLLSPPPLHHYTHRLKSGAWRWLIHTVSSHRAVQSTPTKAHTKQQPFLPGNQTSRRLNHTQGSGVQHPTRPATQPHTDTQQLTAQRKPQKGGPNPLLCLPCPTNRQQSPPQVLLYTHQQQRKHLQPPLTPSHDPSNKCRLDATHVHRAQHAAPYMLPLTKVRYTRRDAHNKYAPHTNTVHLLAPAGQATTALAAMQALYVCITV